MVILPLLPKLCNCENLEWQTLVRPSLPTLPAAHMQIARHYNFLNYLGPVHNLTPNTYPCISLLKVTNWTDSVLYNTVDNIMQNIYCYFKENEVLIINLPSSFSSAANSSQITFLLHYFCNLGVPNHTTQDTVSPFELI